MVKIEKIEKIEKKDAEEASHVTIASATDILTETAEIKPKLEEETVSTDNQPSIEKTSEMPLKTASGEPVKKDKAEVNSEIKPEMKEEQEPQKKKILKQNRLGSIGIVEASISNKSIQPIETNQHKQSKTFDDAIEELKSFKDNHEVLWARVTGAIYDRDEHQNIVRVGITCDWKAGIKIVIPDMLYFPTEMAFDYNYKKLTPEEQIKNRQKNASYQVNALVCFTILSIATAEDGTCQVIGNRIDALSILKDYYFTHKNFEATKENTPKKNDETVAHVLSVRPQKVLVECMGIETYISAFNLANAPVTNCKDIVKPGDVLKVRIRKIHTDYGEPYLTLSARTNAKLDEINKISIGSVYLGYVQSINKNSNTATVRLTNGVNVSVSLLSLPTGTKLILNQAVVIRITKKNSYFVMGRLIEKVS